MVNPGSFQGTRQLFLIKQKDLYAEAVRKGHPEACIIDIQRRFFKRYPVDLADDIEPTKAWLDSVDDDAPDPEPESPDEDTMSAEEFAIALEAFEDRAEAIDFKRKQIKRWLVYQYRKDHSPSAEDGPLSVLFSKLNGNTSSSSTKPRRTVVHTAWGKAHASEVNEVFVKRRKLLGIPKANFLCVRAAVTKELFDKLPSSTRKEWKEKVDREYKEAIAEWESTEDEEVSKDPADRQKCIEGIVGFTQPILDLICEYTGMKATLLVGGPEPADGGRLNIIGVDSGLTQGAIKSTFGEIERAAYKDLIIPIYSRFLKKCYTKEECRAAALSHSKSCLSTLMGDGAEIFGSATIHRGEPITATYSLPPSPSPHQSTLPSATPARSNTPTPQRPLRPGPTPRSPSIFRSASGPLPPPNPAPPLPPRSERSPSPPVTPNPSPRGSPAPPRPPVSRPSSPFIPAPAPAANPQAQPAPATPSPGSAGPLSSAPSGPSCPLPLAADATPSTAMASDPEPRAGSRPSRRKTASNAGGKGRGRPRPPAPKPSSPSIPAPAPPSAPSVQPVSATPSPSPVGPLSSTPSGLSFPAPPAANPAPSTTLASKSNPPPDARASHRNTSAGVGGGGSKRALTRGDEERPSKRTKPRQLPTSDRSAPSSALSDTTPAWLVSASGMLRSQELGTEWTALVGMWEAFEASTGGEATKLTPAGRPPCIAAWIQRARAPAYRPTIVDPKAFAADVLAWWKMLQPEWRRPTHGSLVRGNGSLETLRRPGVNGLLSVLAALFFWGVVLDVDGREPWLDTVADVAWVLEKLTRRGED